MCVDRAKDRGRLALGRDARRDSCGVPDARHRCSPTELLNSVSFGLVRTLNALGLLGLTGILLVAFGYQFILGELPCPLCLLQRAGFAAAGVGLALNVSVGSRPSHYAM